MKVLFIGQKAFGSDVLNALLKDGVEIIGVINATSNMDKEDQVENTAKENNLLLLKTNTLKSQEVEKWIDSHTPDLIVMAFVTLFMPYKLVEKIPHGAINYHPSLLPRHRGASAMHWALLQGDKETGVSVFYIDNGIDTGDILLQKKVTIDPDDTVRTLYFEKLYPLGVQAMREAVKMIKNGTAKRIPQDNSQATYEPPISEKHLIIDWSKPLAQTYRKIRTGDPGIGATAFYKEHQIKIWASSVAQERPDDGLKPGEVIQLSKEGLFVKAGEGILKITRLQLSDTKKIDASEIAQYLDIRAGEVLS